MPPCRTLGQESRGELEAPATTEGTEPSSSLFSQQYKLTQKEDSILSIKQKNEHSSEQKGPQLSFVFHKSLASVDTGSVH